MPVIFSLIQFLAKSSYFNYQENNFILLSVVFPIFPIESSPFHRAFASLSNSAGCKKRLNPTHPQAFYF